MFERVVVQAGVDLWFKGVCDFLLQKISSHDTFSLHPDPNHNPNTDPNHSFAVAVTCLKIKGCEINCREINYIYNYNYINCLETNYPVPV